MSEQKSNPIDQYCNDMIAQYGTPTDVIDTFAVFGNPTKPVLLYSDFLVYDGVKVLRSEITDITCNNQSLVGYMPNNYQVLLKTTHPDLPRIHLETGDDMSWAREILDVIDRWLK